MNKKAFPKITTVVEAEPWKANHKARITHFRAVSNNAKQNTIKAEVLPL